MQPKYSIKDIVSWRRSLTDTMKYGEIRSITIRESYVSYELTDNFIIREEMIQDRLLGSKSMVQKSRLTGVS